MKTDKETKNVKIDEFEKIIPAVYGDLYLIDGETKIEAVFSLRVSRTGFIQGSFNDFVEVEVEGTTYKGIIINYFHDPTNGQQCDYGDVYSNSPVIPIEFIFNKPNQDWVVNSKIRIMLFNEKEDDDCREMKRYFKEYLKKFKYDDVTTEDFNAFNDGWNERNQSYQVNSSCTVDELINKSKSNKKNVESKASSNGYLYEMPRYTKDGGVLTLKLKQ